MIIRLLTALDVDVLSNLLEGQKSYFGVNIDDFPGDLRSPQAIRMFLNTYLRVDNQYFRCYGAFDDDGTLLGTISSDFMQDQPTWILRRICLDESIKGRDSDEIIHALMAAALDFAESVGYYQHIYLIPAKYKRAHAKIWQQNGKRKDRYAAYELERVPAGGTSRFRLFNEMLFGRLKFPIDTVVRMSVLVESERYE